MKTYDCSIVFVSILAFMFSAASSKGELISSVLQLDLVMHLQLQPYEV